MKTARQKISFLSCMGRGFEILKALGDAVLRLGGNDSHLLRIVREPMLANQIALVLMGMAKVRLNSDLDDGLRILAKLMGGGQSGMGADQIPNLLAAVGVSVKMDQEHWLRLVLQVDNPREFVDELDQAHQSEFLRCFDWRKDPELFRDLYEMMSEEVQQEPEIQDKWNEIGIAESYTSNRHNT